MMEFKYPFNGQYIYPPRPSRGGLFLGAPFIQSLEKNTKWVAQAKLNGQNNLAYVCKNKIRLWTRHATKSRFKLSLTQEQFLLDLHKTWGDFVINFEALDRKRTDRGCIYIYDILVVRGNWLVGTTYAQRLKILKRMLGVFKKGPYEFVQQVIPTIWVPKILPNKWDRVISKNRDIEHFEGLMVKNIEAKLAPGLKEENNISWCLRYRK